MSSRAVCLVILLILSKDLLVTPFAQPWKLPVRTTLLPGRVDDKNEVADTEDKTSLALQAAWFGTEFLGKIAASVENREQSGDRRPDPPPRNMAEAASRLRADYDQDYFVSGKVDAELYDMECVFADPFASFKGRQRFIDNLKNLGLFIVGSETKLLSFDENLMASPPSITTRVMVKLQLNLPWKPVLAWPWGVRHEYDPTSFLIVEHRESWEVSASEGVMQCFRPGSTVLLNKLEPNSNSRSD